MTRLLFLAITLTACGTSNTLRPAPDVQGDVLGLDVAVDAPPDAAVGDTSEPEASVDATTPDAPPDAAVDVMETDLTGSEAVPIIDADPPADVSDGAVEAGDAAVDVDPLEQRVTALSVTVRAPGYDWTMPRTQMCTITGSSVSVGADFERPTRIGFTVLGPVAGPVTFTEIAGGSGTTDLRATVQRSSDYSASGSARANVFVRGVIAGGRTYELTALGCLVR